MAYEALYTRTRPKCLAQLVGQDHISLPLTRAVNQNRLAHAYLLVGTRGTGKTSTARLMAKAVNCDAVNQAREEGRALASKDIPCGQCEACLNFKSSPDNVEFDAASNRSVEDIGRLLSTVYLAPMQSRVKTFIIDEVHMLSFEAVNSILKLIEEPPDNVIFFLATTEYNKVPLTIRSRCQILNFKLISQEKIADYITRLGGKLELEIDADAARKLARLARGSMRDALTLIDQCYSMIDQKRLTLELVDETLGLVADSDLDELIGAVREKDRFKISELTSKVLASGITAVNFAEEIITRLRDLITALDGTKSEEFLEFERMIDLLRKAVVEMHSSGIADIILETTLLQLTTEPLVQRLVVQSTVEKKTGSDPNDQSPDDPLDSMKGDLTDDDRSTPRGFGNRIVKVLINYFSETKAHNIISVLTRLSYAEFKNDKLTLMFQNEFSALAFDESHRAKVGETVDRLLDKKVEIVVNSLEKPDRSKKSFASTVAKTKGPVRRNILVAQDLFGDLELEESDE